MQLTRRLSSLCLLSTLLLASCAPRPTATTTGGTDTAAPPPADITANAPKSALAVVAPAYPGPYQSMMVNGEEMRVGRYSPGPTGGTLVRSIVGGDPKVFNPWTSSDTQSRDLAGLMFSGLVGIDPYTGDLFPDLAAEFKIDPDGLTYTTRLRKGLKWSDGKPITSEDVAFTWNTIIAQGYGNSSLRDVTTIDGKSPTVTVVDELTNKFVTPKPFAPFGRLLGVPIAPKHVAQPLLKKKNGRELFQQLWAANCDPKSIVTCGPFKLDRYLPSQRVEFVPTDNFYMVNKDKQRLPYLERIIYTIVPDVNTNLLKFRAKEIDVTAVRARDVSELMKLQDSLDFKLYNLGQAIGTTFVMFNMNERTSPKTNKPYVDPIKQAWFNDVNFRQAVNHAINRDNMVANYLKGIGSPLFTAEPPASPYFNKSLQPFSADPQYALSLLEKSGFKRKEDGFLYDKDGNKVEFDLLAASGGTFYEAVGNMIVDDLKKIGMKVNFQMIDFNVLNDKISNSLDWQACIMSLSPGDPLEPNDGANLYKSDGRLHVFDQRLPDDSGKITVTDARPWEKRLDQLFNLGAETLDKSKRREIYDEYQKIVYDEAPMIYLVSPMTIVGTRNTIGNYQPTQLSQSSYGLHNIEEIYKKK
jgi:peptide/nickel transport system substrate-binding protein